MEVGNGQMCWFWSDNWSPYDNLLIYLEADLNSRLGIPLDVNLASLYSHVRWLLRPTRTEHHVNIHCHLMSLTLSEVQDNYVWALDSTISSKFSTGSVYTLLRRESENLVLGAKKSGLQEVSRSNPSWLGYSH